MRAMGTAACLGSLVTAQLLAFAGATAQPAGAAADPVLMAAGDIGCDPTTNTPANCPMNDTAAIVNSAKPGYVLALGDIQYTDNLPPGSPPTLNMYLQGYDSAWGRIPASVPGVSINPTAGNHDWGDPNDTNSSSGATLGNYIGYFNSKGELRSGVTASTPWYSFDIPVSGGSWHVIMLDNECGSDGGCGSGSPQETFLRNDLAAHPNVCTIAAWHRPRFSSGAIGNRPEYAQFWTDLANAHASVVLAGSDHDYERFNLQTPAQVASSTGIAQYVVGTGGAFLPGNFGTIQPNSAFRDAGHWGALKMTLHATSYDHAFVTTAGTTEDAGTVNCSNTPASQPAVSGLNPTAGPAGGGNSVVISGSNLTGATSVKFGTVAATGLTPNSATQLTVTAPAGAPGATVDITVTTPSGTSITNTSDRYTYQSTQPQVSGVSPPSGPAAGGTTVTISGTNLSGATAVKFGTAAAASFNAMSATQVTAVSPPGTDQTTVDVAVSTPAGTSATGPSDRFTYGTVTTPPTVAAVTPFSGPSAGGNSVSLTGSGFTGASAVKFGTVPAASFTVGNAGLITAVPPAGTANLLDVTVTNPAGTSGTSTADQYSYTFSNNGYAVSLAATTTAPAVGAAVNLVATANKDVGPTPYGLGIVDVTTGTELVHGGSGTTLSTSVTQSSAVSHRYMGYISNASMVNAQANSTPIVVTWGGSTAAPTVSGVTPNSGSTAGGTAVTITGTGLTGATSVRFGATNASFTVGSATSITATAPAGAAGTVDVTVTTPAGTSATSGADQFTYAAAAPVPTVTGVSPVSGSTAGGTSVVITGTGFTGASAVKFGAVAATGFTVGSATSITATAPAGAAGTVDITVTTPGGTSATGAAGAFTYVTPAPVVSGLSPTTGSTAGGASVTISGTNFTGATGVSFGATAAAGFTVNSATSITATSPAAPAGQVDITVTAPAGTSALVAADKFTYATPPSPPTVTGVSPLSGSTAGGTSVVISGTNFTGATGVSFGTTPATGFTVNNAGQITATSPARAPGPVDVTVTNLGGTSPTGAADTFTFVTPPPAVSGVNPNAGPAGGGTSVVISGMNFTGASGVSFGTTPATSFTLNNAGQITAVAPAGSGQVDVTVTTPAGTSAAGAADRFTYTPPPSVTGVSPVTGTSAGGSSVVISGTNLTGATGVRFGATAAASFTVNNAAQITAVSPSGAPGTVDITVTTPAGTSGTGTADQFTFVKPPPSVASVSPNTGPTAGGTVVTIGGANFTPGTPVVNFGATAGSVTAFSATSITVTAPAGVAGIVDVHVTTPGGTSPVTASDRFTYADVTGPPTVTNVTPISGPSAGGTSVVISGTNFGSVSSVQFGSVAATSFTVNSPTQITASAP
ncbi:MAG TPA: IPT/TIG domain-containing protein, partial [Actinomycetota bacterium]